MKKVLSFCVLSVLLAVLSLGLKAQSGLVLTPPNLPSPLELNQFDTIYLGTNSACFDSLGLVDGDPISIEWQVLYNGSVIPDDSLSFYFEEFKFESRYEMGSTSEWYGRTYVSGYCQNGNGYGTYPGANTPILNPDNGHTCSDPGHFAIAYSEHSSTYQFDYFYVRWFKSSQTDHRLVYNVKVDGDYQFVFSLAKRCGNYTPWTLFRMKNDDGTLMEGSYVGGHQSVLCEIVSSDTVQGFVVTDITDYYRCVGDTLVLGDPAVSFYVNTDTNAVPGYDSVYYMNSSSCGAGVDSIVRFRVFFEDPSVPVLDTANSTLVFCDSGQVSIMVTLTAADKSIWLDDAGNAIDTLAATAAFIRDINSDTTFYVLGFNSASGCVSSDTLAVYAEVFASPNPTVTATPDTLCENSALTVKLDQEYDKWTWFHNGDSMNLDTIAYYVADAQTTDAGAYWAEVSMNHVHSLYSTVDTIACSAYDTVQVVVYPRPSIAWATLDNIAVVDSTTFCPNELEHVLVATITGGQAPYNNIHWTGTAGTASYNANKSSDTLSFTLTNVCDTVYSFGIDYAIDSNGCTLKDTITVSLFVNDTVAPTIAKTKDTISAPAYASCEFVLPDVLGIIDTADDCGIDTVYQFPEAGQHVTTDTIVIVTVTDLCGNTATDTINVALPYEPVAIDTVIVTRIVQCAGNADGEISVTVEDGLAPYDVQIQSVMVPDSIKTAHGAGPQFDFTGLIEGKWVVTVTDTNGCTTAADTVDVASPNVLTLTSPDSVWMDLTCFESNDGSFWFNVKQGTAPYEVKIVRTLGAVIDSVEMTLNSATLDTTVMMTDQKAGVYVISVVDDHGCTATLTDSLTQPEQLMLVGDTVLAHVLCFGDSIGNLAVTGVTGGTYPYSYAWVNTANDTVSTDSVTGAILPAGIYTIYVTDAHGCTADTVLTDTIKQPHGELTLTASDWTDLTCFESNDGSFKYNVTEGTAPYYVTIVRTLGTDTETINDTLNPSVLDTTVLMQNMKAGAYAISVVDAHGCVVDTLRDTLTQPDQLTLVGDTILNHVKCFGDANGNLAVTGVTGGTTPYVYEWRYAANDSVVSSDSVTGRILTVGTYTIYITDANNCAPNDTLSATILGPDTALTVLSLVAPVNDTCPHLGNYMFTAEVKGGRTDYTFQWTFNADEKRNYTTDALKDTCIYNETTVSCDTTFDVVFTVTDDSSCVASRNLTFTIQDTTRPTFTGRMDTLYIDACLVTELHDSLKLNTLERLTNYGLTLSDNCTPYDSLRVNYSETVNGTCPFEVKRTYSITDKCGLTSDEITQVIYVQDTTAPVFTTLPQSRSVACDGRGNTSAHNSFKNQKAQAAVSDNCTTLSRNDIVMALDSVVQGCNSATQTYYYSFTVSDACGNTTTEYATFRIYDSIAPEFLTVAPNIERECSLDNLATIREEALAMFTYTDGCVGAAYLVSDTLSDFNKACGTTGSYTHYVVITDSCQTDTASHKIIIVDNTRPVIHANAQTRYAICDGHGNLDTLYAWLYSVTAEDACSGPIDSITVRYLSITTGNYELFDTLTLVKDADGHFVDAWDGTGCDGAYHFQWEALDSCMNSQTAEESFRITDTEGPVFTLTRADTVVMCGTPHSTFLDWLTLPDAYDVCSRTNFPVEILDTTFVSRCGSTGMYSVSWRATDACGTPSLLHTATYTIIDTIAPVITSDGDTLRNDTLYFASTPDWDEPSIDDWDMYMSSKNASDIFVTAFLGGVVDDGYTIHYLNTGITDIEECGYLSAFYYTNTGEDPYFTSTGCEKQYIVDYTFVDACNKEVTVSQTIVILDTTPPIVDNIVDTMYLKGYNDGCAKEDVDTFFTIQNVKDHPKADPKDQNIASIMDDANYVTLLSVTTTSAPGSTCDSIEVRTYEIKDACENARTFTHTIVYLDTIVPVISPAVVYDTIHQRPDCNTYYEIEDGLTTHFTDKDWLETNYNLTIRSCHDVNIAWDSDAEDTDDGVCPGKVIAKKYKVTKECAGREYASYFTIRLIVKDTVAPVAIPGVVLKDSVVYFNNSCQFTLPDLEFTTYKQLRDWAGQEVYDDCKMSDGADVQVTDVVTSGDLCDSVITYKYIAADSCGNWSRDTVNITLHVRDTLAPVVTVATATLVDTMYYENDCSIPSPLNYWTKPADALDHHVEYEDCFPAYGMDKLVRLSNETSERDNCTTIITVPYQVKDSCGNLSDTIYQVIHVLDTVHPIVSTVKDTATYMIDDASSCWGPEVPYFHTVGDVKAYDASFTVTDCNVGDNSTVRMVNADSSDIVGCVRTVVRTYVVRDSCDLESNQFTHTITVTDTTAPAITGTLTPQQVEMTADCGFTYTVYGKASELPTSSITINDCTLIDTLYSTIDTLATAYIDACNKAYTVYISYEVKDSCNHSSMFYDTVYVADVTAPTVEGLLDTATLYLTETCGYTVPDAYTSVAYVNANTNLTITDCKLKDTITSSEIDTVGYGCPMLIHRTCTVSDSCGRTADFDQFFFVQDTFAPKVTTVTLTNDTVYIADDGTYTAPTEFSTAADLNGAGAGITDCNLVQEVSFYDEIPTISHTACDNYLTRKYTVKDSCNNISDTIFHKIVLIDTVKPVMQNMPDTVWATFVDPCTFIVPDLRDTVARHYHDNWTDPYDASYFVSQVPDVGAILVNPNDTLVVVTFRDACGNQNTDTVRIINWADTEAPTYSGDLSFEAFFAGSCTFEVPNLEDTIKNHYADNWNDFYATGSYYSFEQTPANGYQIPHFTDTVVTVIYGDKCGNKDTVEIRITVPDSLYINTISMEEPNCYGESSGKIRMSVTGGTADFTYEYSGASITTNLTDTLFKDVAAGTYIVTVTDAYQCFDTATIVVTQPDTLILTSVAINLENCLNGDTTEVAMVMTGGTLDYNMTATLLHSDYSVVNTVFDVTGNSTGYSDTVKINPIADTLYVEFYGEDAHGCSVRDTSDMIVVHPIFQFDTAARVCLTTIQDSAKYVWRGKIFPASMFADVADSTYTLYDSLQTVHHCDSVYVMHLQVTNNPYLLSRKTPAVYANDISDAVEQVIMDTLATYGGTMSWEFFVNKNCMNCGDNNQVTIQYEWYVKNGDTYEQLPDVTNYFFPQYRTYYDNTQMDWFPASNNIEAANVLAFEIPHAYGSALLTYKSFTYYNLCWLMPTYRENCLQTYYPSYSDIATYGNFYNGGRAHTVRLSNFAQSGDYKLVVTLRKHAGGTPLDQFTTFSGCMDYSKIGGESSHYVEDYDTAVVYFNIPDGMTTPAITPAPIGGAVVYSSNNEDDPQAIVYPNPARDYIQVELTGFEGQTNVFFSNTDGKVLHNINLDIDDVNTTTVVKIATGDYAQGVYMVTARNKESIITKRVVLIK